jgi:hypothetical protein
MQMLVYLDWNIFNKIEKLESLNHDEQVIFSFITDLLLNDKIGTLYSNAHINDLARGYSKNSAYTDEHLNTITRLTKNICMVQYWGEQKVKLHYRDPKEFLMSTIEEGEQTASSFSELLYLEDEPLINALWDLQKTLLKMQPVDPAFRQIYATDPIFNTLYPKTKIYMNMLSLCEDLFNFSSRIKTDYVLYRHFQKYLTQLRMKFPQYQKLYGKAQHKVIGSPDRLSWDKLVDHALAQVVYKTPNAAYDKIFNLFTTIDLKGYNSDERFTNLIDDALHSFYASHCQYFITIDKRCIYKAKKVYEQLKLPTKVFSPSEFFDELQKV